MSTAITSVWTAEASPRLKARLAGLGYLTFLVPPLANSLYPFNLAPAALAEPALILWLLIVGVNVKRWKEQASAAAGASLQS